MSVDNCGECLKGRDINGSEPNYRNTITLVLDDMGGHGVGIGRSILFFSDKECGFVLNVSDRISCME